MPHAALWLLVLLAPSMLAAQGFGRQQELGRRLEAEVAASLFFGNTRQTLAALRTAASRTDSTLELRGEARFNYGEATDEENRTFVSKRSWLASANLDHRPFASVSPFILSTVESSLERRLDIRYNFGGGSKVVLARSEESLTDVSVALLGERSRFPGANGATITESLARWSARFRTRHSITDRLSVESVTFYRPELDAVDRFTFSSVNTLGYQVTPRITLRLSFVDNYDSEARDRGARTNNDGELVVGVMTTR